jgi:hypothetical protein
MPLPLLGSVVAGHLTIRFLFLFRVNIIDYVATLSFYIDVILQRMASHLGNADVLEFFSIIREARRSTIRQI